MIDATTQEIPDLPEPDVYLNVPFDVYKLWPYLSKSAMSDFIVSPAQHAGRVGGLLEGKQSDAYLMGSLTDLEWVEQVDPEYVGYATMPEGMPKRGKRWETWLASIGDGVPVPFRLAELAKGMVAALNGNARALALRAGAQPQVSLVWDCPRTGLRRKGRPDLVDFIHKLIADLKTARDVRPHQFQGAISEYLYHWQLQGYAEGLEANGYGMDWRAWIIAVRNAPIHSVACRPMSIAALELAAAEQLPVLQRYRECVLANDGAGDWPADDTDEKILDVPAWRYRAQGWKHER